MAAAIGADAAGGEALGDLVAGTEDAASTHGRRNGPAPSPQEARSTGAETGHPGRAREGAGGRRGRGPGMDGEGG